MHRVLAMVALVASGLGSARAQDGFKPMFNGKDLTGWVNVNGAPGTWSVKDNMIITTGKPTGYMRTDKQYENFIAEFEWLHVPPKAGAVGNSGFFVWCDPIPAVGTGYTRGIEVQVLVNLEWTDKKSGKSTATSHGDLFSIHGATCVPDRPHPLGWARSIPSENRAKGENEWNHYRVEGNDGVLKLAVNGKFVSMVSKCNPRKGYLALEAEGSECRFKNLKIKELPSTNPKAEEVCDVDKGWKNVFTGLDLAGWKSADANWKAADGVLRFDGKTKVESSVWSDKAFGDFEIVCDCKAANPDSTGFYVRGSKQGLTLRAAKKGVWNRAALTVKGDRLTLRINNAVVTENARFADIPGSGPIGLFTDGTVEYRSLFVRDLKD